MATHPGMLIAYDADGNVITTLPYLILYDETLAARPPIGMIDFASHEEVGGEHTDIWVVEGAKGSKVWPEYLDSQAHDFRVELEGEPGHKRIGALVHKLSGHRRERAAIEAAIEAAPVIGGTKDIRHLVGGPAHPLRLDVDGKTAGSRRPAANAALPLVGASAAVPMTTGMPPASPATP